MKKVRYAVGAVGLAPLALGMVLPVHARAAAAAPATTGKKVAVPVARTPQVAAGPTNGCTTTSGFTIAQVGNLKGHGWQADNDDAGETGTICVGTLVESVAFNAGTEANPYCKTAWAEIYLTSSPFTGHRSSLTTSKKTICGIKGETIKVSWGVHKTWNNGFPPLSLSLRVNIKSRHSGATYSTGIWLN